MRKSNLLTNLVTASALLFSTFSFAGNNGEVDSNSIILAGHDAIAYFSQNAGVEGT